MHDDRTHVEQRIDRVLSERLRPAVHPRTAPCDLAVWHVPGEPVPAAQAIRADYTPTDLGTPWGPPWSTSWFRLHVTVPETWHDHTAEVLVDLGFDADRPGFQCEGLAHTHDGTPIKALK